MKKKNPINILIDEISERIDDLSNDNELDSEVKHCLISENKTILLRCYQLAIDNIFVKMKKHEKIR